MKFKISTFLPCTPVEAYKHALTPRLLMQVAHPMVAFVPMDKNFSLDSYPVPKANFYVKLFGFVPMGVHTMRLSEEKKEKGYRIRDDGYSGLCKAWDHVMSIDACQGGCCYSDNVEIKAGILTSVICLYAWLFYSHRQHRWRRFVKNNFKYDEFLHK